MSINLTNRETIRDAYVVMATAALVGSGKPLKAIYAYEPDSEELAGKSPVQFVTSGPTKRDSRTMNQRKQTAFTLVVQSLVRLDGTKNAGKVEDRLDLIEKEQADMHLTATNINNDTWDSLVAEESTPGYKWIGGNEYRTEVVPVRIEKKDD